MRGSYCCKHFFAGRCRGIADDCPRWARALAVTMRRVQPILVVVRQAPLGRLVAVQP